MIVKYIDTIEFNGVSLDSYTAARSQKPWFRLEDICRLLGSDDDLMLKFQARELYYKRSSRWLTCKLRLQDGDYRGVDSRLARKIARFCDDRGKVMTLDLLLKEAVLFCQTHAEVKRKKTG